MNTDITQRIDSLKAQRAARFDAIVASQLALPLWNEQQRGVPNGLLRSALFGAIRRRGKREFLRREVLASVENVSITYTGIRLCQDYLTVWEGLVHIAREQQLGSRCEATAYQLLKLIGKQDTGGNRRVLRQQLAELQATAVEIRQSDFTYSGSLIEEAFHDEKTGRLIIKLNQPMVALFQDGSFTRIGWNIRRSLDGTLSKWLHGFYSSHRIPYPYTVVKLHELCGSAAKSTKVFEETLIGALDQLATISKQHGEHFEYIIQYRPKGQSLVHVSRDPSIKLESLQICG